ARGLRAVASPEAFVTALMAPLSSHNRRSSIHSAVRLFVAGVVLSAGLALAAGDGTDKLIYYYRKKSNLPRSQKVAVTGLKDSSIKRAKEGTLEIGEGAAAPK